MSEPNSSLAAHNTQQLLTMATILKPLKLFLLLLLLVKAVLCQVDVTLTVETDIISETESGLSACAMLVIPPEFSGDVTATVILSVQDGTATNGMDFTASPTPLMLTAALTMGCFTITINRDSFLEGTETFDVTANVSSLLVDSTLISGVPPPPVTVSLLDSTVVTFGFAELEHTFSEGEASPQVCVTLGDGEVIVRPSIPAVAFVTAIPGTALEGTDYGLPPMRVELDNTTPPSGTCITLPIINDDVREDTEMFTLALVSAPVADVRIDDTRNGTDIEIVDDDEVTLDVSSTSVFEAQEFVEVCVQLSSPPSMMDRNISLVTMDMTALATVPGDEAVGDYEPLNVMVVFPIGSTELRMCVNITVNVDGNLEGPLPEMFVVNAISENGDDVSNSPQPISIISEDTVTVGFAEENYTFAENTSLFNQMVCVRIQEGEIQSSPGPIQIQLNLSVISLDGTANSTAPADFIFPPMNIFLSMENTTMCFSAGIVDDIIDEDTEEFTLSIVNDPEAIFNIMQGETTIIITDNDNPMPTETTAGATTTLMPTIDTTTAEPTTSLSITQTITTMATTQSLTMTMTASPTSPTTAVPTTQATTMATTPMPTTQAITPTPTSQMVTPTTQMVTPTIQATTPMPTTQMVTPTTQATTSTPTTQAIGTPTPTTQATTPMPTSQMVTPTTQATTPMPTAQMVTPTTQATISTLTTQATTFTTTTQATTSIPTTQIIMPTTQPTPQPTITTMPSTTTIIETTPQPILCPHPPLLQGGTFTVAPPGLFQPGSQATYQCKIGFKLNGDDQLTCQDDGAWLPAKPGKCVVVVCKKLMWPTHGIVVKRSLSVGSVARYYCLGYGFTLTGDRVRTCQPNGTWSGTAPTCTRFRCPPLSAPSNGHVLYSKWLGSSAWYSCRRGYKLCGNETRVCGADQVWTGDSPTCEKGKRACEGNAIDEDLTPSTRSRSHSMTKSKSKPRSKSKSKPRSKSKSKGKSKKKAPAGQPRDHTRSRSRPSRTRSRPSSQRRSRK